MIAGILDPQGAAAGEALRGRLRSSLGAEEPVWAQERGPLALAGGGGVERAEAEGTVCLFEGRLHNGEERAWQLGVPAYLGAATLVLRGYEQLGAELWPLLRGDFVVLVWDREAEAGALVRDQLGGRALYLHRRGSVVAFATELRQLVELLPRRPAPDDVAVAHWLLPSVIPEDRTLFAGIEEVPPATCLALGTDGARARRYWAPRFRQQPGLSLAEASAQARELLTQAVERRAGERSAILLSGGIDSAAVAGLSCASLTDEQRPLHAYSAVFPRHPEIDEGPLIGAIAAHDRLAATAIEAEPGGLLAAAAPYMERWQALPPTPNLSFLRPLLDRAAADGVRLLHDGEGGDAVFWYSAPLLAERLRHGRPLSAWALAGRFPEYGVPTTWRTRLGKLRQWGRRRDFSPSPQGWLSLPSRLLDSEDPAPGVEGPAWWVAQVAAILGPGSRMAHDVTRRNAALSGLEPSHPLLDVDLIEAVLSFPPELAFERRFNRPVLREAVAGLVPDEARLRPYKSNFDPVIVAGTEADLPLVEALLLRPGAHIGAYADRDALAAHIASPPQPLGARRAWAMSLWFLGTMECWLRLQAGQEALPAEALRSIGTPGYSFSSL
ncbi:MAG TPA: asparagine synthase-related protein [Solirubrobacterales bacterium]|nr:asparagine synthase-related protein [Solirubrobacterales bacterium]